MKRRVIWKFWAASGTPGKSVSSSEAVLNTGSAPPVLAWLRSECSLVGDDTSSDSQPASTAALRRSVQERKRRMSGSGMERRLLRQPGGLVAVIEVSGFADRPHGRRAFVGICEPLSDGEPLGMVKHPQYSYARQIRQPGKLFLL